LVLIASEAPAQPIVAPPPPTLTDAPADVQEAEPARPRNGFSAKVSVGPRYQDLHGHAIWSGAPAVAFGAQFKDVGAIHGDFSVGVGNTDGGLMTSAFAFGPTWEFILGAWRLGGGPQLSVIWMTRASNGGTMVATGACGVAFAGIDLVQGETTSLHLGLDGRLGRVGDMNHASVGLSLGVRFKTP
ncbi:MAG: hypothetical protein VB934_07720, partial [Polyangiaceae bacterium]